jgi:hypothetical protein
MRSNAATTKPRPWNAFRASLSRLAEKPDKQFALARNRRAAFGKPRAAVAGLNAYAQAMQESLLGALRVQRPQIRSRWAALLRVEPVGTPLGHPDALVHLIDWTMDEVFTGLTNPLANHDRSRPNHSADHVVQCVCGRNPLLIYFAAGEQATREGLILAQAGSPALNPVERDASLAELNFVLQQIARREIEAFCGVCQFRNREAAECCDGVSSLPPQPQKT